MGNSDVDKWLDNMAEKQLSKSHETVAGLNKRMDKVLDGASDFMTEIMASRAPLETTL